MPYWFGALIILVDIMVPLSRSSLGSDAHTHDSCGATGQQIAFRLRVLFSWRNIFRTKVEDKKLTSLFSKTKKITKS